MNEPISGIVSPPRLTLLGKRTKTIEKKIRSLVKRKKSFYLTTMSLDNTEEQTWLVNSWGWANVSESPSGRTNIHKDNKVVHIKNCLKFFGGPYPVWYDPKRTEKRIYIRRTVSRGKGS